MGSHFSYGQQVGSLVGEKVGSSWHCSLRYVLSSGGLPTFITLKHVTK